MKTTYLSVLIFLFVTLPLAVSAQDIPAKVTSVHDGDTLSAIGVHDKIKYKIRLLGIDTPETDFRGQSQGAAAQDAKVFLQSKLPKGTEFYIGKDSQFDSGGRVLAQIIVNDIDLNKLMLREGMGYFYLIAPFSKRLAHDYSEAAFQAFTAQKGVYSNQYPDLIESYLFRMTVQGLEGKNLVGHLKSKDLFDPSEITKVPVYERVFFMDEEQAFKAGYRRP